MKTKALALRFLKPLAASADRLRPRRHGVVVLLYHRVGARTEVEVDLPTSLFERQMEALAETGRAVTLDRALEVLAGSEPPTLDPVVVTFDDGTADFAELAVPIMVRHGVPATLYLATDFIERGRSFPDQGKPLSWTALGDVVAGGGVTVGSHTHTHALLDRLGPADVASELDRSSGLIEDRLGLPAQHFAYPKAVPGSPAAEIEVRRRFRSAALSGTRVNRYGDSDAHRLARSPIQVSDGMRWYTRKLEGGMGLEDVVRTARNRRRYALATN